MSNAKRDQNGVPTKLGISGVDGSTIVLVQANPSNHALKVDNGTGGVSTTLLTSYSETNQTGVKGIGWTVSLIKVAQCFHGSTSNLMSAKFYLKRQGTITGNAVATLYALTGTFGSGSTPTGSALATSDNVDVSALSTSSFSLVTFTFSGANQYSMSSGTDYFISIEFSGGSSGNFLLVGINSAGTGGVGNSAEYSVAWNAFLYAVCFYVYISGNPTYRTNAGRDENEVPTLMAISNADGITPIVLATTSDGKLLIQST